MRPRPQSGARRRERPSIKDNNASQEKKGASSEKRGKVKKTKTGPSGHRTHVQTVSEKREKVFLRIMIQKGIDNDVSQEKKEASHEKREKFLKKSGPSGHRTHGQIVSEKRGKLFLRIII